MRTAGGGATAGGEGEGESRRVAPASPILVPDSARTSMAFISVALIGNACCCS